MSGKKKNVWITPLQDGGWGVQREGGEKKTRITTTKAEAVEIGKTIAKNQGVELVVQRKDGTIQSKDSFGPDPLPPQDKEH